MTREKETTGKLEELSIPEDRLLNIIDQTAVISNKYCSSSFGSLNCAFGIIEC